MSCLNPHDPQMMRIFTTDGAFHTIAANNGGGMAVLGHDCPLSNKRSGRRRNSWCVQTGRTSRNGKGWDEPEVSYTFTCASDFAVVVLGG